MNDTSIDLPAAPSPLYLLATALLRHAISVACAALATHGVLTPGDHTTQVLIGSAGTIVMLGWSWVQKLQHSDYVLDLEKSFKARLKRVVEGSAPVVLLAIAVSAGAGVLISGCAGLKKPTDPAAVARQIATKTNPIEHAIVPLQDLEVQAERAALVLATDAATRDGILKAHITIQKDIKKLSSDVRHVAEVALGRSTDPLPLGQLVQQLTAEVQPIANDIETQFGVSASTRTAIGAAATVISAAIATLATS
jgi:hypothetical protein